LESKEQAVDFSSLRDIADGIEQQGGHILAARIRRSVRLVSMAENKLDIVIEDEQSEDLPGLLAKNLFEITGRQWLVSVSVSGGGQTVFEEDEGLLKQEIEAASQLPVVEQILSVFPGSEVTKVTPAESETKQMDEINPERQAGQ